MRTEKRRDGHNTITEPFGWPKVERLRIREAEVEHFERPACPNITRRHLRHAIQSSLQRHLGDGLYPIAAQPSVAGSVAIDPNTSNSDRNIVDRNPRLAWTRIHNLQGTPASSITRSECVSA